MLTDDDVKWDGELPIVLVSPETGDGYLRIEQGEGAEARAAEWVGAHPEIQPVIFDIHDERCSNCNRTFWHEAASGSEKDGWHCPHCEKLLPISTCGVCGYKWDETVEPTPAGRCPRESEHKDDRVTVGDILKDESDALQNAMTGLANADSFFESAQEKYEAAEDYFRAVGRVVDAAEELYDKARKFLHDSEEAVPE